MLSSFFIDYSYYFVFFLFLSWVYHGINTYGDFLKNLFCKDWKWLLAAFLITTFLFISISVDYKVLSDETNLFSVARCFSAFQKTANNTLGVFYYETYHPLTLEAPTRPLLFPFLASLLNLVIGTSDRNPFILNFLLTGFFLYAASLWHGTENKKFRFLAFLGVAASPVFSIHATSAGFDVCSILFGILSFYSLRSYLTDPDNRQKLSFLVLSVLCFASVRYETLLLLPVFFAAAAWVRRGKLATDFLKTPTLLLTPLFMVPLILQRIVTWGHFENPPGVPPFSVQAAAAHFPIFLEQFFTASTAPYLSIFHWFGLAAIYLFFRSGRKIRIDEVVLVVSFYILFGLMLAHHMGIASHPTQVRLFLPFSIVLVLMGATWLSEVKLPKPLLHFFFAIALLEAFVGHSYASRDPLTSQLILTRETHYLRSWMRDHKTNAAEAALLVYDRPGQFTAFGYGAVDYDYFRGHTESLKQNLRDGLYNEIYVLQHRSLYDGKIQPADEISATLALTELGHFEVSESDEIVVSKLEHPVRLPAKF